MLPPNNASDPEAAREFAELGTVKRFLQTRCTHPDGTIEWEPDGGWVDPATPAPGGGVTLAQVMEAVERMAFPVPKVGGSWPKLDEQMVNVPTWFHITAGDGRALPVGRSIEGQAATDNVVVTGRISIRGPIDLRFQYTEGPAEPVNVTCTTPGKPWSEGASENDPERCAVKFLQSGAGTGTITVHYSVDWEAFVNGVRVDGGEGLPADISSAPFPFRVRAYEAVIR